jgi:molybdopterin-synthase adenylyltransferase
LKSLEKEWNGMRPTFTDSRTSIKLSGVAIPGAEDRQEKIHGFDQAVYSRSRVLCIGAGGLISHIAPTLVRKGVGALTVLDNDIVEVSNLNRQRFYPKDIGHNKAIALVENLVGECIVVTNLRGYAVRLEDAIAQGMDLSCNVAICGVDNNPARVAASRYFRAKGIPVIFTAVSADADHGYVFVQEAAGPCIGCLFPDIVNDDRYPCPGTPAVADILQAIGALAAYAVDHLLMDRPCIWNYRRVSLSGLAPDGVGQIPLLSSCAMLKA